MNRTIIDINVLNMSLIIMVWKCGAIDVNDYFCHGYYTIKFSSSPYTLQAYLIIDGQVLYSSESLCEGTHLFPININYYYYVLKIH